MIKNIVVTGILAVCAEGALLAVYFVKSSLLEGKIQDFFEIFNLSSHLNNFVNGMLDIQGIIYFLSVIVICIFLTIQSLQKKRWN